MTEEATNHDRPLVSIVFYSGEGHTTKMAEAVEQGVRSIDGVSVVSHQICDEDIQRGRWMNEAVLNQLDASDAVILGSPTYMGSVSAQLKSFMDATSSRYLERKWVDKIGAAFTVSGSPSGDKVNMLMTCTTFALQHGMVWVGVSDSPTSGKGINRLGIFFGAAGQALFEPPDQAPTTEDKQTGEMLGRRVARFTRRLFENSGFAGAPHE